MLFEFIFSSVDKMIFNSSTNVISIEINGCMTWVVGDFIKLSMKLTWSFRFSISQFGIHLHKILLIILNCVSNDGGILCNAMVNQQLDQYAKSFSSKKGNPKLIAIEVQEVLLSNLRKQFSILFFNQIQFQEL